MVSNLPDSRAGSGLFVEDNRAYGDCMEDNEAGVLFAQSPPIIIPAGATEPRVAFDHWVATEVGWDGGNIKISVNGGPWMIISSSAFLFNPYPGTLNSPNVGNDNPMADEEAFTGTDGGSVGGSWGQSQINLTSFASPGDTIRLRFEMGLDGCNGALGWYVDDVDVYQCVISDFTTLEGTVTDDLAGWPLYATVDVTPQGGLTETVYTDPVTGYYSKTIVTGMPHRLTVNGVYPSYTSQTRDTLPLGDTTTENIALLVDAETCAAPGYQPPTLNYIERFDSWPPAGWTINNLGGNCTWADDANDDNTGFSSGPEGNLTGGSGGFADADSDHCGVGTSMDTDLVSPALDMSGLSAAFLEFDYDYRHFNTQQANVDISMSGPDGPWTTVWTKTNTSARGPASASIDLSAHVGSANTHIRFHFDSPGWNWWWQVDNVHVTSANQCVPQSGGLVVGHVYDQMMQNALNNTTVSNDSGEMILSMATPDDPALDDSFYYLFSPAGPHSFTATITNIGSQVQTPTVVLSDTIAQNFGLAIPAIDTSAIVSMTLGLDQVQTQTVVISNTGQATLNWTLTEAASGTINCQASDLAWVNASPNAGTTAAQAGTAVDIAFDSTGLGTGVYEGTLCIQSNDPLNAVVTKPLELRVVSYGVQISAPVTAQSGLLGATVTYTLWITNTSDTTATFDVAVTGNSWLTIVAPTVGPLAAGDGAMVDVTVTVDLGAGHLATDTATIIATSQTDATATDQVSLVTTALTDGRRFYLPLIEVTQDAN